MRLRLGTMVLGAVVMTAAVGAAARCKAVTPLGEVLAATSALAASSALTTAALPVRAATWSGVYWPMRVTADTLAPA